MSTAESTGGAVTTETPWPNQVLAANARGTLATLVRPPRRALPCR